MTLNIEKSILTSREYSEEHFVGVSFDEIILYKCIFQSSRFDGGELIYTKFINCTFEKVIFYFTYQLNCIYVSCNFTDLKFGGVNFEDVTFVNCSFTRVLFRHDNLRGGCDLASARFIDCEFNECSSLNSNISTANPIPKEIKVINIEFENVELL